MRIAQPRGLFHGDAGLAQQGSVAERGADQQQCQQAEADAGTDLAPIAAPGAGELGMIVCRIESHRIFVYTRVRSDYPSWQMRTDTLALGFPNEVVQAPLSRILSASLCLGCQR
jgi:hypothetical protein